MRRMIVCAGLVFAFGLPALANGQQDGIREQLLARGAPPEFALQVAEVVAAADAQGLPTQALATKALEGWAKRGRVPPERVLFVLESISANLRAGRTATTEAGLDPPPRVVVAAAAEALGRGMTPADVQAVIGAADSPEAASMGLTVASSLAAQGLERAAAVRAVRNTYQHGGGPTAVLELPSAVAGLVARGVPMSDVARQILEGEGLPLPAARGLGLGKGRPGNVPPGRGPPIEPPGHGKPKNPGDKGKPPGS